MTKHQVKLLSSRKSDHWQTPPDFYKKLNQEFNFDFDPCPFKHDLNKWNGLEIDWKKRNFINPPYSNVKVWIEKALKEIEKDNADVCVFLVNANTDTKWFHDYIYKKHEIRFIKNRICFIDENGKSNKSMRNMRPSMLIILKKTKMENDYYRIKLGNLIELIIKILTLGQGKRMSKWIANKLGFEDCGCDDRKKALNNIKIKRW
jgi:phage N-6-adenine-methyltransferase